MAGDASPAKKCLCDVASLRFKFNEVFVQAQKFMTEHPESDCGDLQKTLELLHKTIGNLTTKLRLEKSIGVHPHTPVKESTPYHLPNPTEFHTAEQSFGRPNATIQALPQRTANDTFDVSRQPGKNATFNVQRSKTRTDETFDASAPERYRRGTKATFEISANQISRPQTSEAFEESTSERSRRPQMNATFDASDKQRSRPRTAGPFGSNATFSCKYLN